MSDVVQQARELLAGITPGKWTYRDVIDGRHNVTVDMWDVASCSGGPVEDEAVRTRYAAANAEFIAAAPQLVSELADKLSEVRQIIADDDARGAMPDFITLDKLRQALEADHG